MTNVPPVTFGSQGFIAPPESAVLAGVTEDINSAFGGGVNPALNTPQGQLATSIAAIIGFVNDTFLYFTNQVDPAYATGRMQDAIARIYNLTRIPSAPTVLQVPCVGLGGTVIAVGSLVTDSSGNIYASTDEGTIPSTGTIVLPFAAQIPGPIAVPGTDDISIYQAISGWDSVTVASGVVGNDVESRSAFEARRLASVAKNSVGSLPSILGEVLDVAGVLDAYVTENNQSTPETIGGVVLAPKSLYVAAVGGEAQAIAEAIWAKKAPGCGYNGNTTETVLDTRAGYVPPYPSYEVTFERPDPLAILFEVKLINSQLVPSNATTLVQNAILSAFAGGDGGPRARIGTKLFASRFYSAIAALGSWVQIISILVGSNNTAQAEFTGSIAAQLLDVTVVASGALAVGQTISGVGITPGTRITGQASGTPGGIGTYDITNTLTVASEAMVAAKPTANDVTVNIDQSPTLGAGDVQVILQ